ncbi:FAD-dependent monooxygenase [Caballeronia sp. LZ034LL]|uniref:FAD-dependent monooxygenase n=1 Tax=Caballeronia sp. LZ034LL TaxID=3038567 RepID=UPI00286049F9|nr:FAD-dependent monooxygenase [Caballeronia sp. LZ034LL]MDR5835954.1 FAD-dependent monooxygenase [Caballeronia sp. LZ034LL]
MKIPVLIVGAGPVGMTLASELDRYGIPVRIVDKAPHRTDKSKAMVLWSRTLELLDRGVGGAAPFVDAGFKLEGVTFIANDRVVGRVAMDSIPSLHNYALALPQSETERLLEERLVKQGVRVERDVEATMIAPDDSGADTVLVHGDGRKETVRADWMIGCDGAHSTVRHAMSVPFAGETLLSDWFLADVHMSGYPRPDTDASIHWHKDGVLLIFPIQPGRYRIIGDLPATEGAIPPTPTLDQVQDLVDQRGPAGTRLSGAIWLSGFRINGRKVASYRESHTFLAGDAAHIHSPAGGQGMNTGMQDAMNLGWKLALVIKGDADESLLDSYSPERSSVGDTVLKAAERLTAVATIRNPVAQQLRNLAAHFALRLTHFSSGVAETMSEVDIHWTESGASRGAGSRWLGVTASVCSVWNGKQSGRKSREHISWPARCQYQSAAARRYDLARAPGWLSGVFVSGHWRDCGLSSSNRRIISNARFVGIQSIDRSGWTKNSFDQLGDSEPRLNSNSCGERCV